MTTSKHRANQPGAALAKKEPPRIVAFEPIPSSFKPRQPAPYRMDLKDLLDPAEVQEMTDAGEMVFHCVGDTGGVKRPESQALVARGMEESLKTDKMAPAFFYHLGDVVYYTGEVAEYWPQYYEPYEQYPLPIFGIAGNHDGEKQTQSSTSLLGYYENFCAAPNTFTHESKDSGRKAGTQPWIYWTLTTPFATIIGLYTNVPEHGRLDDDQRAWFRGEMKAADPDKALIVALHHPVYSFDKYHSGSPTMAQELEDAINESRRLPNMVWTAHVHNYQRIELVSGRHTIPFFVIGNGGYWNLHYMASVPGYQDPETEAKLIQATDSRHGFMTFAISPKVINGNFTTVPRPQESWSNPNAYDTTFDVFSYSAVPMHLSEGETVTLLPRDGSHVQSDAPTSHGSHPAHSSHGGKKTHARKAHAARTAARLHSHRDR